MKKGLLIFGALLLSLMVLAQKPVIINNVPVGTGYTIEVDGQGKDGKHVADTKDAFIAADGMEYALGNKIPLWLFGFLY